jgi:hypothetical protein
MTRVAGATGPVVPVGLGHAVLPVPVVGSGNGRRRVVEERTPVVVVVLVSATGHDCFSSPVMLSSHRKR